MKREKTLKALTEIIHEYRIFLYGKRLNDLAIEFGDDYDEDYQTKEQYEKICKISDDLNNLKLEDLPVHCHYSICWKNDKLSINLFYSIVETYTDINGDEENINVYQIHEVNEDYTDILSEFKISMSNHFFMTLDHYYEDFESIDDFDYEKVLFSIFEKKIELPNELVLRYDDKFRKINIEKVKTKYIIMNF